MPAASESDLQLEIGHVLLIDIVGYSKLLITEQRERLQALNEIVRNTAQFRASDANGMLVRIPTGDGMALIFRDTVEAPLRCAVEISEAVKTHPEIHLRMGIHSGPVSEVRDVNERTNIAGAGIDIAQRVMDCGDAGHILLSKHVAEDLAPHPRWNRYLYDLGECEVKHGDKIFLVNFYTDELGNPRLPEKLMQAQQDRLGMARASRPSSALRHKHLLIAAGAILIAASGIGYWIYARQITVTPLEKSIAVLPFENLSGDPNSAYFTEGIQEEILTRLAKIADLKVISRTSTLQYQSKPSNLGQIAKQLGVANILEGSVQKAADQVRVNVQLIKAATDAHLWADTFDRKLTDIFAVESEIARSVAETLQAKLSGKEQSAIAARPTENSEAHDLYLKGRYFFGKRTADDFKRAIDYFNQAIARDPNYALAYAGLADTYMLLPGYSNESSSAELFPKARAAAEKALAIDKNLAEAHVSLGLVLNDADLNLKAAKREYERAIELNPNYAAAHYFLGLDVFAPLGQVEQAIVELKRAVELDPFSAIVNMNLGGCYLFARRYPEAIAQLRKTTELDPNFGLTYGILGQALELSGDSVGAIREYEKAHEVEKAYQHPKHLGTIWLAYAYALRSEREKALQLLGQLEDLKRRNGDVSAFGLAMVHLQLGQKDQAIDWLERSYQDKEMGPMSFIKVNPTLDPLRGDPRFEELANQIVPPDSH